jgi:hypothetical protein
MFSLGMAKSSCSELQLVKINDFFFLFCVKYGCLVKNTLTLTITIVVGTLFFKYWTAGNLSFRVIHTVFLLL